MGALQLESKHKIIVLLEDGHWQKQDDGWFYHFQQEIEVAIEVVLARHRDEPGVKSIYTV